MTHSSDTPHHVSICKTCSGQLPENKWLPKPIASYRNEILAQYNGEPIDHENPLYPVFSNIAYNLQYLEYQNKCFEELYLTSVIRAQNVKMFLLTVSQIIECLLYVRLVEAGIDKNDIWEFNRSLSIAKNKNAFGLGAHYYDSELRWLKDLRNHIHIQSPAEIADADYAVFESIEVLNRSKEVLVYILQRALKMPTADMQQIFYFLEPTKEFVHSKDTDAIDAAI